MVIPLKEIARLIDGEIIGDGELTITGINSLKEASEGELSFYYDRRYRIHLDRSEASALIVAEQTSSFKGTQVVVSNPALAYARLAELFLAPVSGFSGISPQAYIQEGSQIGESVTIYPFVFVGDEAVIGDGSILYPGVYIGDRVQVGDRCILYPNVTILHDCVIGNRVIIHAGTIIGSDGFGYLREGAENIKIPQIGTVQIDDDVEIGANNAIDRAAMGKTWIQQGVKTDNLVQIAHNVVIGGNSIIVAQTAVAGSARIGKEVILGGQVAISDHVTVGDRAMVGSQSGVPKSIPEKGVFSGTPAMPHSLWLRTRGLITRLPNLNDRVRTLEKRIQTLEKSLESSYEQDP